LHGPPGTGKTTFAKTILLHAGVRPLFVGTASELNSKWFGETERKLKELFASSAETPNLLCAIVLDEIDNVVPRRGSGERNTGAGGETTSSETKIDLTSILLSCVEARHSLYPNVLLIGCTNRK